MFRSLTLLRMLSLDASLIDPAYASIPSSKLDALFEHLDDVVAADTIEDKVMALKETKAKLVEAVLDDEAVFAQSLTPEDIRALLEP